MKMDLEILTENWRRQVKKKFSLSHNIILSGKSPGQQEPLYLNGRSNLGSCLPLLLGAHLDCHASGHNLPGEDIKGLYLHRCPYRFETFSGNQSELFGDK